MARHKIVLLGFGVLNWIVKFAQHDFCIRAFTVSCLGLVVVGDVGLPVVPTAMQLTRSEIILVTQDPARSREIQ